MCLNSILCTFLPLLGDFSVVFHLYTVHSTDIDTNFYKMFSPYAKICTRKFYHFLEPTQKKIFFLVKNFLLYSPIEYPSSCFSSLLWYVHVYDSLNITPVSLNLHTNWLNFPKFFAILLMWPVLNQNTPHYCVGETRRGFFVILLIDLYTHIKGQFWKMGYMHTIHHMHTNWENHARRL